ARRKGCSASRSPTVPRAACGTAMLRRAMRRAHLLAVPLLLGSLLTAQAVVSPSAFYATREGDLSTPYGFSQPSRLQQVHADLVGAPRVVHGIAFRRDGIRNAAPHAAVTGKTVVLTLVMADAVGVAAATNQFEANATGNVATVFSGPVATPAAWMTPARSAPAASDFRLPIAPWP